MNLTGKHLPVQHLRQINNRRLLLCMFPDVIKTFLFRRTNITVCSVPIAFTAIKQFLSNESHIRFHRTMLCIPKCIKRRGHRNINRNGQFDTLSLYGQRYINIKVHIPMHTVLNGGNRLFIQIFGSIAYRRPRSKQPSSNTTENKSSQQKTTQDTLTSLPHNIHSFSAHL